MKITVLVPCFNASGFISDAILTVLNQTHEELECIVVDDASLDQSAAIVAKLAASDSRIKLVRLEVNGGPGMARHRGMEAATGDWITFLDSDDLYAPDRLERMLCIGLQHNADCVIDNQSVRNFPHGAHLYNAFGFLGGPDPVFVSAEAFFKADAIPGSCLKAGYMKPMIRRSWLLKSGISFDPSFRIGEDFLFYAEMMILGAVTVGTNHAGYIYRRRQSSISRFGNIDIEDIARASDIIIGKYRSLLSPSSIQLLELRRDNLRHSAALKNLRLAVMRREFGTALRIVRNDPTLFRMLPFLLRRRLTEMRRNTEI